MRPSFFITDFILPNIDMVKITRENALPDKDSEISVSKYHLVNNREIKSSYPDDSIEVFFGLGCFWGAERLFWNLPYVHITSVGYGGGFTRNPTYQDLCSGMTGHAELVKVVFIYSEDNFLDLLKVFWENHDPTQGMRQGNDIGTQYRSCIYINDNNLFKIASDSKNIYGKILKEQTGKIITTEIKLNEIFYYAEDYHQQYLEKNPSGYCGLSGTGINFVF